MALVPHERALVKRLKGKPFVLLGVNADSNVNDALEAVESKKMTWRSWRDRLAVKGPISRRYEVHMFPALYLIDRKGVIRASYVERPINPEELDIQVDNLLAEGTR